ncbi:hypothetical protein [Candidatus Pyrohabitans sp.]
MRISINVKDETKAKVLIEFLKELPFVDIEKERDIRKIKGNLEEIFGIWKDREISKKNLREKAWRM